MVRTSNHSIPIYLVPVCWPAITDSNIGTAVDVWCSDESSAIATYGMTRLAVAHVCCTNHQSIQAIFGEVIFDNYVNFLILKLCEFPNIST